MTLRAHILAVVLTLVVVGTVLRLLNLRQLRSKYALLWLAIVVLLLPFAAFPTLLQTLADLGGVTYGTTAFLLLGVGFLFLVVVHFSWELSRLETRSRTLAEEVALLRAELGMPPSRPGGSREVARD